MKKLILICTVLSSVALAGCVYRPYGYRDGYYRGSYGNYYGDRYYNRRAEAGRGLPHQPALRP